MPDQQTGRVGPLEVVQHHQHRLGLAGPVDQCQQLLGRAEHGVPGAGDAGGVLLAQQPEDVGAPRVLGPADHFKAVEHGAQREGLSEFVGGRPEHLAAQLTGGAQAGGQQRGLADAGVAFDHHGLATAGHDLTQQPAEQGNVRVPPHEGLGRRGRPHGARVDGS
nr:hypothetical protein [Kutzneria sp. CA-103260]